MKYRHVNRPGFLLGFIDGGHLLIPFQGDSFQSIVLVHLHDQPVQLRNAPLRLGDPLLEFLRLCLRLDLGFLAHPLDESLPVEQGELHR